MINNLHRHNGQVDNKDPGDRVLPDVLAKALQELRASSQDQAIN